MVSKLLEYLNGRKIAPIVKESKEKHNEIALKLMCVIDQKLEVKKVYDEIDVSPKLLKQLLSFHSFGQFHFFKYRPLKRINHILKCKHCSLQGPYYLMLSHMALSHGSNIGSKMCLWCNETETLDHVKNSNLITCYEKYLEREDLEDLEDLAYPSVIIKFYDIIENLASSLGVLTYRKSNYTGRGYASKETHYFDDDDIDSEVIVHRHRLSQSTINIQVLNQQYGKIMEASNGVHFLYPVLKLHRIETPMPINNQVQLNSKKRKKPRFSNAKCDEKIRQSAQINRYNDQCEFNGFNHQLNDSTNNNQVLQRAPLSSTGPSKVGFGNSVEAMTDTLPNEQMKMIVKLKVQTLILEYSTKAIQDSHKAQNK